MCEICNSAKRLQGHGIPKSGDITRVLIHMRELRKEVKHFRRIYGTDRVALEYHEGVQGMQGLCEEWA